MKNNKFWKTVIYSSLVLHLVISNAKILNDLNTKAGNFGSFDNVGIALAILFAFSYSLSTLYLLTNSNNKLIIISFALLDGFLIGLWYVSIINGELFIIIGGVFYAVYTALVFIGIGFLKERESDSKQLSELTNTYEKLLRSNDSVREINQELADKIEADETFLKELAVGYILYAKWRVNKTNDDKQKNRVAELFELTDKNFNFIKHFNTNYSQIKNTLE